MNTKKEIIDGDATIEKRRDEALRRALNTPPRQHKDMKKGKGKKQQDKPATSQKQP